MLTNSEIWYGIMKNEVKDLEEVDRLLLRRIVEVPTSTPIESFYLELGLSPINAIIKARRINYLHYLVSLEDTEMLSRFFQSQWRFPIKNDWVNQVKDDFKDFNLNYQLSEIKLISKTSWKKRVKLKMKEYSLDQLNKLKGNHSKMEELFYPELRLQNYLKDVEISVPVAKNLFRWRTRTAKFKLNYKGSYLSFACPSCLVQPDSQAHSVQCPVVKQNVEVKGEYKDIFTEDIPADIANTLLKISTLRKEII